MSPFFKTAAAALSCAALTACDAPQTQSSAQAASGEFVAINGLTAVSLSSGIIEVKGRPVRFKDDYWCAVGDYARRGLRLPWDTEIYVLRDIGAAASGGARSAVQFTVMPDQLGVQPIGAGVITNILQPGYSRNVTHAFGNCRDTIFPRPFG